MQLLLLSRKEAAQRLNISLRTIDNLIATKELRVRRIGRRVLIAVSDLEQFARRDHSTPAKSSKVSAATLCQEGTC